MFLKITHFNTGVRSFNLTQTHVGTLPPPPTHPLLPSPGPPSALPGRCNTLTQLPAFLLAILVCVCVGRETGASCGKRKLASLLPEKSLILSDWFTKAAASRRLSYVEQQEMSNHYSRLLGCNTIWGSRLDWQRTKWFKMKTFIDQNRLNIDFEDRFWQLTLMIPAQATYSTD